MRLSMGLTRRLLSLLLSLVCLLGMILPAAAVKAPRLEPKIKTVTTARIHLSTGSRSRVIGQLEDGTVLMVMCADSDKVFDAISAAILKG